MLYFIRTHTYKRPEIHYIRVCDNGNLETWICAGVRTRFAQPKPLSAERTTRFFFSSFGCCWNQPAHTNKIHNLLNYRKIWNRATERAAKRTKKKEFVEIVENVFFVCSCRNTWKLHVSRFRCSHFTFVNFQSDNYRVPAMPCTHFTISTIFCFFIFVSFVLAAT